MRIFTTIRHSNDPRFYYGGLWSGNFYPALRELGHDIVESQVDLLPASRFMDVAKEFTAVQKEVRAGITQEILDEVRRAHQVKPIDLFLSYFYNSHFDPGGFDQIKLLGIPTVNFFCNSIYQFSLVADIAGKVDFSWHAECDARPLYLRIGANPVWVQMGADPEVYRPLEGTSRTAQACFVGQRYADRDRWIAALVSADVPLAIYGPGWSVNGKLNGGAAQSATEDPETRARVPQLLLSYLRVMNENLKAHGLAGGAERSWRQYEYRRETQRLSPLFENLAKGSIPFEEIRRVFSSHEVILNFSNVWGDGRPGSKLIPHVRLRDFEAPMCRSCYLTGYTDEINEFYELGKEIITYQTVEELVDKTKYYLSHEVEAERMRQAGYRRALRDHTWRERFKQLFRELGLAR